ncbi:MAG: hypothetical protein HRF46_15140 [Acidobacteriota bacterium]|jgi:hypothetical protein
MDSGVTIGQLEGLLEQLARRWERFVSRDPQVPFPPERERLRLEQLLREVSREEGRSTVEQFRLEQLQHRFSTLSQLWQRQLRDREEVKRGSTASPEAANVPPAAPVHRDEFGALFATYAAQLQSVGKRPTLDAASFGKALRAQRQQLEEKGFEVDGFEVTRVGDEVKVRARARRRK